MNPLDRIARRIRDSKHDSQSVTASTLTVSQCEALAREAREAGDEGMYETAKKAALAIKKHNRRTGDVAEVARVISENKNRYDE